VNFKYAPHHSGCPEKPCPNLEGFKNGEVVGYRVLNWPCTDKDFIPVALLPTCTKKQKGKCAALALSLFRSAEEARALFLSLLDRGVDARVRMGGNQIAAVGITVQDGMFSPPNQNGHFSLHESADATLHENCAYWGSVIEDAKSAENTFAS
jgi:hypothetical protein